MTDLELKLQSELNKEQFDVVMHTDGAAVVMAGAGSGKTHTLISRVARLVDNGVPAEKILVMTFTNAAADELKMRASNLLDSRCGDIVACTYHKFCNLVLRKYGSAIGVKDYTILSYPEFKNMIDYVKSSEPMFDNLKGFPSAGMVADMVSLIVNKQTTLHEVLVKTDKYDKYRDYEDEIQALMDMVAKYGRDNQKLTYDDLLLDMNELLANDNICRSVALRFDYIMVDEFQDTNNLQEAIIWKLHQFNHNIVVVGDISQSIYAFRGANVANLQNFGSKMGNCVEYVLNENYRSTQEILDAANEVMHRNARTWKYHDMVSADDLHGAKPTILNVADSYRENDTVIDIIDRFHSMGMPYNEMAIIERSSMESFGIENVLVQKGIDYIKLGGMKFMDYDCIGDMLAYFSVITNPTDTLGWFRLLKLHPNIGRAYAKKVADGCQAGDFLTENSYKKRQFYGELRILDLAIKQFRTIQDLMAVFDMVSKFYFELRERAILASNMNNDNREEALAQMESDRGTVTILRNMAKKYKDIVQFVDDIVLDSTSDKTHSDDQLTITTVHSAKGLEWSLVIILNAIEGAFPAKIEPANYGSPDDEEELRAFYVAMTRAKTYLYLMKPAIRMTYAGVEDAKISHYLMGTNSMFNFGGSHV